MIPVQHIRNIRALDRIVRDQLRSHGVNQGPHETYLATAYRIHDRHPELSHWLAATHEHRIQLWRAGDPLDGTEETIE